MRRPGSKGVLALQAQPSGWGDPTSPGREGRCREGEACGDTFVSRAATVFSRSGPNVAQQGHRQCAAAGGLWGPLSASLATGRVHTATSSETTGLPSCPEVDCFSLWNQK